MKKYVKAELEVIEYDAENVIVTVTSPGETEVPEEEINEFTGEAHQY